MQLCRWWCRGDARSAPLDDALAKRAPDDWWCRLMSCRVGLGAASARVTTSLHSMWCHVMACCVVLGAAAARATTSLDDWWCRVMSRRVVLGVAAARATTSLHSMWCHVMACCVVLGTASAASAVTPLAATRAYWEQQAPTCDGYPSKDHCDDGDMVLFGSLLCASGETPGCDLVRASQDASGRWWRSPRAQPRQRRPGSLVLPRYGPWRPALLSDNERRRCRGQMA